MTLRGDAHQFSARLPNCPKSTAPEGDGADEGAGERKRQDDGERFEERLLLERVARVEDDGRQQDVEEDRRLERDHVLDDVAGREANDRADEHAAEHGDDRFVDRTDAADLEVVRDPERQDQQEENLRTCCKCARVARSAICRGTLADGVL